MQGQPEQMIEEMSQMVDAVRAAGIELLAPHYLSMLAEVYGRAGRPQEGLAVIAAAVDVTERTGARLIEPNLYWLKGELLLAISGDTQAEAESCFRKVIGNGAKALELRASTSLARLWQKQGRKEEARQMLADIYGWFTEGFDTRDLKEAKALLEELG